MNKGFLILVGIIFVAGLIYLNGQVADACTHGNCVHGWDSKYTKTEQANFRLWFFGFPITIYILYRFFNSDNQNNRSYQEKVDYSKPKRVVKTKKQVRNVTSPCVLWTITSVLLFFIAACAYQVLARSPLVTPSATVELISGRIDFFCSSVATPKTTKPA